MDTQNPEISPELATIRDEFVFRFGLPLAGETNQDFAEQLFDGIVKAADFGPFTTYSREIIPVPSSDQWRRVRAWESLDFHCRDVLIPRKERVGEPFQRRSYWQAHDNGLTVCVDMGIDWDRLLSKPELLVVGISANIQMPYGRAGKQANVNGRGTLRRLDLPYQPGSEILKERQRRLQLNMDEGKRFRDARLNAISQVPMGELVSYESLQEELDAKDFQIILACCPTFAPGNFIQSSRINVDDGDYEWLPAIYIVDERGCLIQDEIVEARWVMHETKEHFLKHGVIWLNHQRELERRAR